VSGYFHLAVKNSNDFYHTIGVSIVDDVIGETVDWEEPYPDQVRPF
jgi:hypothetical protein